LLQEAQLWASCNNYPVVLAWCHLEKQSREEVQMKDMNWTAAYQLKCRLFSTAYIFHWCVRSSQTCACWKRLWVCTWKLLVLLFAFQLVTSRHKSSLTMFPPPGQRGHIDGWRTQMWCSRAGFWGEWFPRYRNCKVCRRTTVHSFNVQQILFNGHLSVYALYQSLAKILCYAYCECMIVQRSGYARPCVSTSRAWVGIVPGCF
jgi:hypothetical protein